MNNYSIALKCCTECSKIEEHVYWGENGTYGQLSAIKGKCNQIRVIDAALGQI